MIVLKSLALAIVFLAAFISESSGQNPVVLPYQCNFDTKTCPDWKNSVFRLNGPKDNLVIKNDHTNPKKKDGKFMFIRHDKTMSSLSTVGSMNKVLQLQNRKSICFSAWFFQAASGYARLNISVFRQNKFVNFGTKVGNFGRRWRFLQVTLYPRFQPDDASYNLWIKGTVSNGIIGIDDINITAGACQRPKINGLFCPFETANFCGFYNYQIVPGQVGFWTKYSGANTSWPDQIRDHTLGTPQGNFFGIDFNKQSNAQRTRQVARSAIFNATQQACVTFYYISYRQTVGSYLNVSMVEWPDPTYQSDPARVAHIQGTHGINWHPHRFQVYPYSKWQLIFEARGENPGLIGIDDIKIELNKECPFWGRCDFESYNWTCLWEPIQPKQKTDLPDVLKSNLLWVKWRSTFNSPGDPYPKNDTTLGKLYGSYLLMKPNGKPGLKAVMQSPRYEVRRWAADVPQNYCLSFSYFIPATNPSAIQVYQMEETMAWSSPKLINTLNTGKGKWDKTFMNINKYNKGTQNVWFYIQGLSGQPNGKTANFAAIDDIMIDTNPCPVGPPGMWQCTKSGLWIPARKKCDFKKDCPGDDNSDELYCGNCNFEVDNCGYQLSNNDYTWKQVQANSFGIGGPTSGALNTKWFQVSLGHSDYYVNNNHKADLISPMIGQAFAGCGLQFYYASRGNFTLKVLLLFNRMEEVEVWNKQVDARTRQNDQWTLVSLRLGRFKQPFRVIFRSIVSYKQDLSFYNAIDEVKLLTCQPAQSSQVCAKNKFRCKNGVCLDPVKRCDFTDDCGDGSDEANCTKTAKYMCGFERGTNSFCGFNDVAGFKLANGQANVTVGPTRDHTKGLRSGRFLYLFAQPRSTQDPNQFPLKTGTIKSPRFTQTNGKNCSVTFYLNLEGPANAGQATFEVAVVDMSNNKKFTKPFQKKKTYSFERFTLTTNQYDFQWVMTATVKNAPGTKMWAYAAVDDVVYSNNCMAGASSSNAGAIVAAVLTPLFVLGAAGAAGWWYFTKYRPNQGLSFGRSRLGEDSTDAPKEGGDQPKNSFWRNNPMFSSFRKLDQSVIDQDKDKRLAEMEQEKKAGL